MSKLYIKNTLTGLLLALGTGAYAQKLPKIQEVSLRAPVNTKIDGKATEWNNQLQAYNSRVEFYYTLSNDDKNLYLTVYVPEREVVRRVLNGGLSLNVSGRDKNGGKNSVKITYPVFDPNNRFAPRFGGGMSRDNLSGHNMITDEERASMIMVGGRVGISLTKHQADSLMKDNNTNFPQKATNIAVAGVKDIDSLISVYNEFGIKAAGSFDIKAGMTCEMAVPLKYLPADGKDKLTYQLMINAVVPPRPNINSINVPNGAFKPQVVSVNGPPPQDETDISGRYTLAPL